MLSPRWAEGISTSPATAQPCNRATSAGSGKSTRSSGRGSPNTSRAGWPRRSSRFRTNPRSIALRARRRAVDVLTADDAGDRLREALNLPVVRQALDHLLVVDSGARRALHVDQRRFTGHGDRFVLLADLHVRVDGCDEVGAQFEALDLDGVETGKREPSLLAILAYAKLARVSTDVLIDDDIDLPET